MNYDSILKRLWDSADVRAALVIAFGNFEGTYYRYAKRYEQNQNWAPPPSEPLKRETKV